jgi:hypothetical protein
MIAKDVLRGLKMHFRNYDYILFNTYMYAWECDFWALSTSKYAVEVEVKISRADFFKDFKKESKHEMLNAHKQEHFIWSRSPYRQYGDQPIKEGSYSSLYFCKPQERLPNKFYYACPEGLIKPYEVPAWAGLLYYNGYQMIEVKKPIFLHKLKLDKTSTLLSKYYYKTLNAHTEICRLRDKLLPHLDQEGESKLNDFIRNFIH